MMKEKKIQELAKRMGLITVENMCQYTIAQLVYMVANKVNELIDEVGHFESDVVETVKTQNENIQYLLGEGLHLEVENIFDGWIQDGTFDTLINQTAHEKITELQVKVNIIDNKKANQIDLETQKSRIDQLTKLGEGSTTGDAELKDIRIGVNGQTFENAGESVRRQINEAMNNIYNVANGLSYFKANFIQGTLRNGDVDESVTRRVTSYDMFRFDYPLVIHVATGYKFGVARYTDDGVYVSDSGWLTDKHYIEANRNFRIVIDTNPEHIDNPPADILKFSTALTYELKDNNFKTEHFKGSFVNSGLSNGESFHSNNRISCNDLLEFDRDTVIHIDGDYKVGLHFFENGEFSNDTGWIKTNYYTVPGNKPFKVTIGRKDDGNVNDNGGIEKFLESVTYGLDVEVNNINERINDIKSVLISKCGELCGKTKISNNRIVVQEFVDMLSRPNFQSFYVDTKKKAVYKLNASSEVIIYDLNGNENGILTKPCDTGHDNDCCYDGENLYISGGTTDVNPIMLSKWNLKENSVVNIDLSSIPSHASNGSTTVLAGVCEKYHGSDELYLVCTDYYQGIEHREDDKFYVYSYNKVSGEVNLLFSSKWDCVYVQGATCINNVLYIACNTQTTGSASNYKGVTIKVIDMESYEVIDEIIFEGTFEPEGMDYTIENGVPILWLGVAKYMEICKIYKFVAPY